MDNLDPPSAAFDLVALAASAGGLPVLRGILAALPDDFPAPLVVLMHLDPRHPSLLSGILTRYCRLAVKQAEDGDLLRPGSVSIARPDHHLVVRPGGVVGLTRTARVHLVRPSADILFESMAQSLGPRALAVVLTGSGTDGADGVRAVKAAGGTVLAQDQATSEYFGMPQAAIRTGCVDRVLPLGEIAPPIVALVSPGGAR